MKFKAAQGLRDNGIVVGNDYDKYNTRNPIAKYLMKGFHTALADLVYMAQPSSIHEIGCGEGYWVIHWNKKGIPSRGSDFSKQIIELARKNAISNNLPPTIFEVGNIYEIEREKDGADLIVCCEVLEHLESPEAGLEALQRIVNNHLILSVPREPIWSALNLARGKYISHLGNTPGHIQNWSKASFIRLVRKYFEILEVRSPIPWTMLLCRPLP